MKLSFVGTLSENKVFMDADTGEPDQGNHQAGEPIRLHQGAEPLPTTQRNKLIERFFDYKNPNGKSTMLREVGVPQDEITRLLAGDHKEA